MRIISGFPLAILMIAGSLLLNGGCTSKTGTADTTAFGPAPAGEATKAPEETVERSATGIPKLKNPPAAPSFGKLETIDGKPISLESLKGKVVVLDFWATWCGPCRMTIPILNELHKKYAKEGLVIVGISDETKDLVTPFAKQMQMSYSIVADPVTDMNWKTKFQVESLPTMVIIDRQGKLRLYEPGLDRRPDQGTQARLNELIPELLAQK